MNSSHASHLVEDEEAGQQHTQREYLGAVVHGLVEGIDWEGGHHEERRKLEWHSKMNLKQNLTRRTSIPDPDPDQHNSLPSQSISSCAAMKLPEWA